jgi:hypothetical protein
MQHKQILNDNHQSLNVLILYMLFHHFPEIVVHNVMFHVIVLVNLDLVTQLHHIIVNEEKVLNYLMIYDLMNDFVVEKNIEENL